MKIIKIFCITMVMVMLTGCSRGGYLAKETKEDDDKFNTDTYDITYQLTPEQQENFEAADYIILCNVEGVGYMDTEDDARAGEAYMNVYGGRNVELDENGVLHGYYGKETLYGYNMTKNKYTMIPLIINEEAEQIEGEMRYTGSVLVGNEGIEKNMKKWKSGVATLKIVVNEKYPNGIIKEVIDKEKQKNVNLKQCSYMEFIHTARYLTRDENGELIDFYDWESANKGFGLSLDLTEGYYLEMRPLDDPENYYCMFYIKDTDGNYSYSELIPIAQ